MGVFDFTTQNIKEDDVLIMATDGLWDVLSNEEVAQIVRSFLQGNSTDPYRYGNASKGPSTIEVVGTCFLCTMNCC